MPRLWWVAGGGGPSCGCKHRPDRGSFAAVKAVSRLCYPVDFSGKEI